MNKILELAKKYSKQSHLRLLPFRDSNKILDNLNFLYDEKWESLNSYPYEILTYLFDCYYVLPERPDCFVGKLLIIHIMSNNKVTLI